ncbi:MobC family plasmid mobilization relaxosome protein [Brytella acorum]|uniref:MobC family plasmid mobilization relaxosome protein n=1 Tax=Brytella acorum TaxID=2959299 RepID=A0AA35V3P8_9PROT|nr:MobC family plasmid mobilization relaxosome protein [Brytella acorum]MDF3626147.1 MobC family plasmid mobilization relaxosome protein [Brytella acorum]CAI9122021.1 MobC family plasmid mobilization relaxosome protein [Brytella acorum]
MPTTYAERFYIKSSPEEKLCWKQHAKALGHNGIAPLMRQLMRESVSCGKYGDETRNQLQKIQLELSKIGNNINQIAKHANTQRQVEEIGEELREITRTRKQISKLVHEMRGRL